MRYEREHPLGPSPEAPRGLRENNRLATTAPPGLGERVRHSPGQEGLVSTAFLLCSHKAPARTYSSVCSVPTLLSQGACAA
eukprot:1194302-Prorocentrum_minimum.AAC.8